MEGIVDWRSDRTSEKNTSDRSRGFPLALSPTQCTEDIDTSDRSCRHQMRSLRRNTNRLPVTPGLTLISWFEYYSL
ncbi:MAG: hypothetical protein AB1589_25855 [Cyanobacteriota bacterium]